MLNPMVAVYFFICLSGCFGSLDRVHSAIGLAMIMSSWNAAFFGILVVVKIVSTVYIVGFLTSGSTAGDEGESWMTLVGFSTKIGDWGDEGG